jgi:hypothetical protein
VNIQILKELYIRIYWYGTGVVKIIAIKLGKRTERKEMLHGQRGKESHKFI